MLKNRSVLIGQTRRLLGAVRSGHPAARLGMFLRAIGPLTRLFDQVVYNRSISINYEKNSLPPSVMIVSPPRSGSTISYQVLVRAIPCVYISNLHLLFPNYASVYLLKRGLFGANLVGFNNYYGYTASIFDINEGNEIVESIFRGNADERLIRERFIKLISAMRATEERPLIFKNVRAYQQLVQLHRAVPEIVFLRIKRDPEQVIQSVVRAYHELGTFHPVPEALEGTKISDPVEFAVRQILEIERTIDLQKEQIEQSKWLELRYEDFCTNPWPMIENLAQTYLNVEVCRLRKNAVSELRVSERVKVSQDETMRIESFLKKHNS